jgi:hypothetical protein
MLQLRLFSEEKQSEAIPEQVESGMKSVGWLADLQKEI